MMKRSPSFIAGMLLGCWSGGLGIAAEGDVPPLAKLQKWFLLPAANLKADEDRVEFHPKALITTGWGRQQDEGVPADQGASSGVIAGGEVRWTPTEGHLLSVEGLGGLAYSALDDQLDPLRGRLRATWRRNGPRLINELEGVIAYDAVDLVQAGLPYLRVQQRLEDRIALIGDRTALMVQPSLERERFMEPGPYFPVGDERDSWRLGLEGTAQRDFGSRLQGRLRIEAFRLVYDDQATYQDGFAVRSGATVEFQPTDHTVVQAGFGIMSWRFSDNWSKLEASDDRAVVHVEGLLSGAWKWRDTGRLALTAARQGMPGLGSNVAVADRLVLEFGHPLPQRWALYAEGGPLRVRNVGRAQGEEPEQRLEWLGEAGTEYWLRQGWMFRTYVRGAVSNARYVQDFTRAGAGLQILVVY